MAEPSVLPLASLNATPQKEFAITNSSAPTERHNRIAEMTAPTSEVSGDGDKIGAGLSRNGNRP